MRQKSGTIGFEPLTYRYRTEMPTIQPPRLILIIFIAKTAQSL